MVYRGAVKVSAEIRKAGGKADFIASDLRDAAGARAVARKAVELGNGHVDILINNAGVFPFGATHEMSEESFDDVYALNVKASSPSLRLSWRGEAKEQSSTSRRWSPTTARRA